MKNGIVIIDKREEGLNVLADGWILSDRPYHNMIEESVFSSRHQIGRPSIHDSVELIGSNIAGPSERHHDGMFSQEIRGQEHFRDRFLVQIPQDRKVIERPDGIIRVPIRRD